jgi:hypothetical protein
MGDLDNTDGANTDVAANDNYPWSVLDISPTGDLRAVKSAYAKKLKRTKPDDDPAGYQQLRDAYEYAQYLAAHGMVDTAAETGANEATSTAHVDALSDASATPGATTSEGEGATEEIQQAAFVASNDDLFAMPSRGTPSKDDAAAAQPDTPRANAEEESTPRSQVDEAPHRFRSAEDALNDFQQALPSQSQSNMAEIDALLKSALDDLPIEQKLRASALFAEWFMQQGYVQPEIAGALDRHFEWRSDYRAERSLGYALASALRQRLDWTLDAAEVANADRPVESTWQEITRLSRALAQKRKARAFWLAFTSTRHTLGVLRRDDASELVGAGIPFSLCRAMSNTALLATALRLTALALPLLTVCLLLSSLHPATVVAILPICAAVTLGIAHAIEYARTIANRLIGDRIAKFLKLPTIETLEQDRTFLITPVVMFVAVAIATGFLGGTPDAINAADAPIHYTIIAALALGYLALIISEQFRGHLTWLMAFALAVSVGAAWGTKLHLYALLAIAGASVAMIRADAFLGVNSGPLTAIGALRIIVLMAIAFAFTSANTKFPVIALVVLYFAFAYGINRALLPAGAIATCTVIWIAAVVTRTDAVDSAYTGLIVLAGIAGVAVWHHLRINVRADLLS